METSRSTASLRRGTYAVLRGKGLVACADCPDDNAAGSVVYGSSSLHSAQSSTGAPSRADRNRLAVQFSPQRTVRVDYRSPNTGR